MLARCICAPPSATLYGSHFIATSAIVDLQLLQLASKVLCSDTTRNEQVKTMQVKTAVLTLMAVLPT